jgi:hypothetical protein
MDDAVLVGVLERLRGLARDPERRRQRAAAPRSGARGLCHRRGMVNHSRRVSLAGIEYGQDVR